MYSFIYDKPDPRNWENVFSRKISWRRLGIRIDEQKSILTEKTPEIAAPMVTIPIDTLEVVDKVETMILKRTEQSCKTSSNTHGTKRKDSIVVPAGSSNKRRKIDKKDAADTETDEEANEEELNDINR